jgi:hypothetical protein
MKTKITIIVSFLFIVSFSSYSQIKIYNTSGKVDVGTITPSTVSNDPNNVLTMHLFGNIGNYRAGSKLAFGDFGSYGSYSMNAFVGEYKDTDCDKLWLHGKNGIYLTWNRGDNIIGYWDVSQSDRFTFNCDVYANGTLKLTSDARLKTNVNKIKNSMSQLRKLNGVSYNLLKKNDETNIDTMQSVEINDAIQLSEKEQKDKVFFEALTAKMKANTPKRMGFIAQDLQKVFPELVDKDSAGYFSVDYIGLIPVIVEALKEQDSIIAFQTTQIEALQTLVKGGHKLKSDSNTTSTESADAITIPSLEQNYPNPFNKTSEIVYYIPESTGSADLYIYNMNGLQIKSIPIQTKGKGSATIKASELNPGMYIYTLVVDGKEIDTKRMILTD